MWMLEQGCNSTSNSHKAHFPVSISVLGTFHCPDLTNEVQVPHLGVQDSRRPVSTSLLSHLPAGPCPSMLQSRCVTLRFQASHIFLPPHPCSRGSLCLECPLPPPPWSMSGTLSPMAPSSSHSDASPPVTGLCCLQLYPAGQAKDLTTVLQLHCVPSCQPTYSLTVWTDPPFIPPDALAFPASPKVVAGILYEHIERKRDILLFRSKITGQGHLRQLIITVFRLSMMCVNRQWNKQNGDWRYPFRLVVCGMASAEQGIIILTKRFPLSSSVFPPNRKFHEVHV